VDYQRAFFRVGATFCRDHVRNPDKIWPGEKVLKTRDWLIGNLNISWM